MLTTGRRIASAALIATAALVLVIAIPAAAGTVTSRWSCVTQFGPAGQRDFAITVTAPATATLGQTATVTAAISETVNAGVHSPAGRYGGQLEIVVGGAGSGVIYAYGMTNPEIQPNTPWRLDGGQAQITYGNAGDVTFKPQLVRVSGSGVVPFACRGDSTPIAATTHVT